MAATVADRSMGTAAQIHRLLLIASSAWHVATAMLDSGHPGESHDYALAAAHRISHTMSSELDAVVLWGALHLLAAHAAEIAGDHTESTTLLKAAQRAAEKLGADHQTSGIHFGPIEVGIVNVEIALEQHDPDRAIRLATLVEPSDEQPLDRRAAYHMCQAKAYVLRRDDAAATLALMKVANISPETLRYAPDGRYCLQHLIRRDNYLTRSEVTYLAELAGMAY